MNLAKLPWEQLETDLGLATLRSAEPRSSVADWRAVGIPMAAFLDSAQLLATADQIEENAAIHLLVELGIDAQGLRRRLPMIVPATRSGAAVIRDILADGTLDLAVSADSWTWDGILGVDMRLINAGDLLKVRLTGQELLRWIVAQDEAPSLAEVLTRLHKQRGSGLILRWTTQTFALTPGYCTRRQVPTLGPPAAVYARRTRSRPMRPTRQPPHGPGAPTASLVDDITAVIAEIALQPVRHRQDWLWRVADAKRIDARLYGSQERNGEGGGIRLTLAMDSCQLLSLTIQAANQTQVSEAGLTWLRCSAGQRQQQVLGRLRRQMHQPAEVTPREDYPAAQMLYRVVRRPMATADYFRLWSRLATTWRELDGEVWLHSDALAWWQRHPQQGTGHHAESAWADLIATAIDRLAIPLGIIARSGVGEHSTIRLTPAGRWAIGLDAEWNPPPEISLPQPIIVQADHTIIFLAPDASLEVAIGAFTERLPGAQATGALFKLSKTACRRAAIGGLDAAQVVRVLSQASSKPLPANVIREVEGWFARLRRAVALPVLLITTSDEETAATLVALLGATRRGPQAVSLPPGTRPGDIDKRLVKEGILLDTSAVVRQR